jgi:hypothetical protein
MNPIRKHLLSVACCTTLALNATAQSHSFISRSDVVFAKNFLQVYKDAPLGFANQRGKQISTNYYSCRTSLGSGAAIVSTNKTNCIFDFGTFVNENDAEALMLALAGRISKAFLSKAAVKYCSFDSGELSRRASIAHVTELGFYSANVFVEMGKNEMNTAPYFVRLIITGGSPNFYHIIHKNEPVRSSYFASWLQNAVVQFEKNSINCLEAVAGFTCHSRDTLSHTAVTIDKYFDNKAGAKFEFEFITSTMRGILGERYVFYQPEAGNVHKYTFITAADHEKKERRSITASLEQIENDYMIRLSFDPF